MLVRRYQGRAVRAAHLIIGDRSLAQDVVQDAFVHAYEQIWRLAEAPPKKQLRPSNSVLVISQPVLWMMACIWS